MFLRDSAGALWAPVAQAATWRLDTSRSAQVLHDNQLFARLNDTPALTLTIDEVNQSLRLETSHGSSLTGEFRTSLAPKALAGSPPVPAVYLDYALFGGSGSRGSRPGALIELGISGTQGVLTHRLAHANGRTFSLDTTITRDFPDRLLRLQAGDTFTASRPYGGNVAFAGVRLGTEFSLQPMRPTQPLPVIAGSSQVPAVADIFQDGQFIGRQPLPAGRFLLEELPVVSNTGEISVVVRDVLGREVRLSQPFITSPQLLAAGLDRYSIAVGVLRERLDSGSTRYGATMASLDWQRGLTAGLSAHAHAEASADFLSAGLGAFTSATQLGITGIDLTLSQSGTDEGHRITFSHEYSRRGFSMGLTQQWTRGAFRELGGLTNPMHPRSQSRVFAGFDLGRLGSLSLAGFFIEGTRTRQVYTLAHQMQLPGGLTLVSQYLHTESDNPARAASLALVWPLGTRMVAQHQLQLSEHTSPRNVLSVQQSPPPGMGTGWRAAVSDDSALELGIAHTHPRLRLAVDLLHDRNGTSSRVEASGSLGWVDGTLFASRRIEGSLALVEVPGQAGVRVYAENQLVGETDASGRLIVPGLRAYERNQLRIDARDLPLDTRVESLKLDLVPAFRSAAAGTFSVMRSRSATLTLLTPDGNPVPTHAEILRPNRSTAYPVGRQGRVFLDDLESNTAELTVRYDGKTCRAALVLPVNDDPLPDLGALRCTATPH